MVGRQERNIIAHEDADTIARLHAHTLETVGGLTDVVLEFFMGQVPAATDNAFERRLIDCCICHCVSPVNFLAPLTRLSAR